MAMVLPLDTPARRRDPAILTDAPVLLAALGHVAEAVFVLDPAWRLVYLRNCLKKGGARVVRSPSRRIARCLPASVLA